MIMQLYSLHLCSLKILVQILVVLSIFDALKYDVSLHVSHSHHLRFVERFSVSFFIYVQILRLTLQPSASQRSPIVLLSRLEWNRYPMRRSSSGTGTLRRDSRWIACKASIYFSFTGIPKVLKRVFLADMLVWNHESRHEVSTFFVAVIVPLFGQDEFVQMSGNEDSGFTYDLIR